MMRHSVEVARFMLTAPGATRDTLRLVSASATTANLKWTRPRYAADLRTRMGFDFAKRPVEDFARGILAMEDADRHQLMIEATTSWAYVGAGLHIQLELLGPEYSTEFSSLSTGLKVFLSRAVTGSEGEDLVEKQNAEQGLMPVVEDEAGNLRLFRRHMVEAFRRGLNPAEAFHDGVGVMEMLMGLYRSAELGRTAYFPDPELERYVPRVAR
jgi:predicted dehydrogenase